MPSSLSDFDILYTIGSGSYGTCKKIKRRSDGKVFVWKEIDYGCMTETEKQMLVSEVNLLRELKHENIVRYHERVVDKKNQMLYIIMEYCEGGDLGAVIKKHQREGSFFDEEMVWKTLAQCASALNECHKRKDGKSILHRDLKPANIFLDSDKNVKLGDFGLARVLHETSFAKTFVGTPYYMSPEQMNKLSYNEKSDIWSLGCVLYEMCTLRPPFLASNQRELAVKIKLGHFSKIPYRYSSGLSQLIDKMLSVECNTRPGIERLLAHPKVAKYIKQDLDKKLSLSGENCKKQLELSAREIKCEQKEAELRTLENELKKKEVMLQALEEDLKSRQAAIEEKEKALKMNTAMIGLQKRDINITKPNEDILDKPLAPILCRLRKPDDSPSKHVSFQVQDKENDMKTIESTITALHQIGANAWERDKTSNDYYKRKELRERLERAKQRANELRVAEVENRKKSYNILNVR